MKYVAASVPEKMFPGLNTVPKMEAGCLGKKISFFGLGVTISGQFCYAKILFWGNFFCGRKTIFRLKMCDAVGRRFQLQLSPQVSHSDATKVSTAGYNGSAKICFGQNAVPEMEADFCRYGFIFSVKTKSFG